MRNLAPSSSWARAASHRLIVATAVLMLLAGSTQAVGQCLNAEVEEPFRLPDGSLHPAGALGLCLERNFSPVASLHEIRVDDMGVGLFMSRRETSQGLGDDPRSFVMFQRLSSGELLLVGVANPLRDRMQVHYLGRGNWKAPAAPERLVARLDDPGLVRVTASAL